MAVDTSDTKEFIELINGDDPHQPDTSSSSTAGLLAREPLIYLDCPLCLEKMLSPKLLHCGHSLCLSCAHYLYDSSSSTAADTSAGPSHSSTTTTHSPASKKRKGTSTASAVPTKDGRAIECSVCKKISMIAKVGDLESNYAVIGVFSGVNIQ